MDVLFTDARIFAYFTDVRNFIYFTDVRNFIYFTDVRNFVYFTDVRIISDFLSKLHPIFCRYLLILIFWHLSAGMGKLAGISDFRSYSFGAKRSIHSLFCLFTLFLWKKFPIETE